MLLSFKKDDLSVLTQCVNQLACNVATAPDIKIISHTLWMDARSTTHNQNREVSHKCLCTHITSPINPRLMSPIGFWNVLLLFLKMILVSAISNRMKRLLLQLSVSKMISGHQLSECYTWNSSYSR